MVPDGEKLESTTVTDTDAPTLPDPYELPAPVEYPSGITLALIIISLSISVFLCAMVSNYPSYPRPISLLVLAPYR